MKNFLTRIGLLNVVTGAFVVVVLGVPIGLALAQNTDNYREQGGSRTVIGGSLDIISGGDLDVESGGLFKIAGTTVTASGAELNIVDGVTATAAEINQWTDESARAETVTATNVIAASESGKTFYLAAATEFVSTLPAPAAGLWFKFVITAAPAGASYTVVTNASANIIVAHINELDGVAAGPTTTDSDTITFTDAVAVVGDAVECNSDGTSWFCHGNVAAGTGAEPSQVS